MEEGQTFQYTQFPNLNVTHQQGEARAYLNTYWHGRFLSLPDEVLILAWASLLEAFTRVSAPVFLFNGEPIRVDIPSKRWTKLHFGEALEGAGRPSNLVLLSESDNLGRNEQLEEISWNYSKTQTTTATSLSFHFNPITGYGLLSSHGCVPESFFGELERQLLQKVCSALPGGHERQPITAPSLSVSNAQRKYLTGPHFLHELISNHWTKTSTAIDFLDSDGERVKITYARLAYVTDNLARRIASQLPRNAAFPSQVTIIPVYIPQCPELYYAWIAVLKANAAFCPIGLDMPPERMKYILKDVDAKIILCLPELASSIVQIRSDIQIIEVQAAHSNDCLVKDYRNSVWPPTNASSDDLAYVMYTSGSTGLPKGVAISHNAVTQALLAHDEHVPNFDRFLQFAAPTFDVSVFETFFPLFRGATLVTRHREHMLGDLPGTLRDMTIDAAELTPTVAGTLLRSREAAPCLRLLLTIGEMLTRPVIEEFAQTVGRKAMLLPMYGPTEASIHCTVVPSISTETKVGIIGRPFSTVTALIVRETEEPREIDTEVLPIGQVGELAVAGQLARGYLNRNEQTTVSFINHQVYGRIYRTGDRARLLPNGDLECLGRISSGQVKIRGQRVELGEIEQVICKAEQIQSATASIIDDLLVAFCVTSSKDVSREQIISVCKLWLPSFMRPANIVLLTDNVPRLSSGKINKRQLEANYRTQMQTTKVSGDSSQSQLERRITKCIEAEISKTVTPMDNLWSFGLDSLRAIMLASRLREEGVWLSVTDILEAVNVAELAKRPQLVEFASALRSEPQIEESDIWSLKAVITAALHSLTPDHHMGEIETFRPCSPLQVAMLVETSANNSLNFNSIELQLPDHVSVPLFYEAFQRLAHHNKILRSGFIRTDTQRHPFCQIIWKRLVLGNSDGAIVFNDQLSKSDIANGAFLYPLRMQFLDRKERRVCVVHIHHALYDGWSFELILQDLEKIISGRELPQRPQFDDVLKYQLQRQLEPVSEATHKYWRDHLQEIRTVAFPQLLTGQIQRSSRQVYARAFTLDLHDLTSTCRRLHVSRQSIVSATFATLLSSYVGSPDVIFGAVSSGRTMPVQGIERIIGPCIGTFPMRLDLSRLRTVRDVINSTHRLYHNFLQFDYLTLADIKTLSGITRGHPLFDSLFVWQEGFEGSRKLERTLTIVDSVDSLAYAIVLEVEPREGKIHGKISFETSKVSADHAVLFMSQLDSLLNVFARFPETPVTDCYCNMDPMELSIENADFYTFNERFTLTSTVDTLAKEDPSRIAIEFLNAFDPQSRRLESTTISYNELYLRSSLVSQSLAIKGVLPDAVISVVMEKSVELYVAILGVIRTGAAYLAIDPQTPADRIRGILQDSRCRVVIGENLSRDLAWSCDFYSMSELESGFEDPSPAISQPVDSKGGDLAYVVYTSGSTGNPKGVLITRNNVLSNIDCLSRQYPSNAGSKFLQACSQAFDVSVFEIFFTWHMGMSLCVAANDILYRDIEHLIRRMNVSHLSLTPSVAALIEPENVPNVEFLVTAGEPMNSKVFNSWMDRGLYQGYGPSETTNICNLRPKVTLGDFPNNVGPPLPNTSIFICQSQNFNIMPRGAVGEIWIGGDQVGRGYLYNEELTRKFFVNHATYGRMYRSGDIGRLLTDGSLVILGRDDDQVKLRGQRIELGEINKTLTNSVVVKDVATVIVNTPSNGDVRLVSFWMPEHHALDDMVWVETQTRTLLVELEARLPAYMIPDVLLPVDHMPLTKQGKIDRRALIEQFEDYDQSLLQRLSRASGQEGDDGAPSQHEALIMQIVADVIGCAQSAIHRDASFFVLGIDSIKSIRLSRKLRQVGFGHVDMSKILRHASVRRLATYLLSSGSASPQILPKPPQQLATEKILDEEWQRHVKAQFAEAGFNITKFLPTTPLQEVMLSSYDIQTSSSYRNQLVFRINGDLAELKLSWKAMLSRHQLLRTGFAMAVSSVSAFAQVVLENFTLPWSWDETRLGQDLEDRLPQGYMLPPYSLRAAQGRNGGCSTLTLRIHHVLYDGEAMSLLLREVEAHYLGRRLPPIVPFDHYLEYMLSLDPTSIDNFWHSQLDGYTSRLVTEIFLPVIPEDTPTHFITNLMSRVSYSNLEAELKHMSTTLLTTLQTSWARLLSFYLQTFDVCFGNVYSGRSIPVQDADQIIGPCFNTLPVRVKLKKLQTIAELNRTLQETNTALIPYQPSSLRRIQKNKGAIQRSLFDALLLLQPVPHQLDVNIWTLVEETGDMNFPVICEIVPDTTNDRLQLRLHVRGRHFPALEARRLLENFDILLQNDLQYSQTLSRDFSILNSNLPSTPRNLKVRATFSSSPLEGDHLDDNAQESFSGLEMKIRQILCEASKTDVALTKKFTSIFQLGLDSIDAFQIAARLRGDGFSVTGGEILEATTIAGIAELCSKHSASAKKATPMFDFVAFDTKYRSQVCQQILRPSSAIEAVLPCTSTQSGILAEFIHSDGRLYFNSLTLKLARINDVSRLKEAWKNAVARHEMLRTGFVEIENADHPFAMVAYQPSVHQLPWKESSKLEDVPGSAVEGKKILGSLHHPPWCLLYSQQGGNHVLKLSILHALYDAQSLDIILADVAALYNGDDLPPPKRIYTTLSSILSQSEIQCQESESFFTSLGQSLQPTRFPDLRIHNIELPSVCVVAQLCTKSQCELRQGCKQAGISLQIAAQCAWAQLLAAYTGNSDVTFGIILSGRDPGERKDSVAFPMMNTLPMPLQVKKNARDVVGQASKLNAALMQRQFVHLTHIKKWLNVKRSLFDTVVVLQQHPSSSSGFALWEIVSNDAQTEYVVSLEVVPDDQDRVTLRLTFQKNLLPPEQAKIILIQCEALLYAAIFQSRAENNPHRIRRHELLSIMPAKYDRIATSVQLLHKMVEQSAQRWPEKVALEFATSISNHQVSRRCWTYKSLDREANKIANLLIRYGTLPGDMIGICFDKCPEASFAILGILKAGCAFIAIDPNAPQARKDFILKDSTCRVLLCNRDQLKTFVQMQDLTVLALDDKKKLLHLSYDGPRLPRELRPEDICYCLYTSGTTGQPKGCLITHDNAVQALLCFQRIFAGHWTGDSRWLQFASFHFDVSVLEQFWSWSVGICVTSAPRDLLFEDMPGAITALQITHLDLTPSLARLLKPEEVPSLCRGVFITGGEQLRQDVLDVWGDVGVLYNFYGPSEVTIGCTVHQNVSKYVKPSNIGQQFDNVGTFVLDPQTNRPVLRGGIGELCLYGPLVGKGYLNRPELTEKKFEYLPEFDVRIYHTGDLVRLLHDGSFEFLGRSDDQVKLRGQRLEIAEINHVLLQSDGDLRDVATMVLRHPKQTNEHLVSFLSWSERSIRAETLILLLDDRVRARITNIRQDSESKLPGYMVPTYLIPVSIMPLSANNKVELSTLKSLFASITAEDLQRLSTIAESVLDAGQPSLKIVSLLSRRLGVATTNIRPSSSLFELGMDSISVIALVRDLKNAGFDAAQPSLLMRNSTVSRLAIALQTPSKRNHSHDQLQKDAVQNITFFAKKHQSYIVRTLSLHDESIERIAPCTPLQEGMISKTLRAKTPVYAPKFTYELSDKIVLHRLQDAWLSVQSQNPILRTKFIATEDGFAQVVLRDSDAQKCFILGDSEDVDDDEEVKHDLERWYDCVQSLESIPWKVVLKEGRQQKVMVVHMFHALFDGISLPLLLEKVAQGYLRKESTVHFDFHEILPFGPLRATEDAKAFWKKSLACQSSSLLDLPIYHQRHAERVSIVKTSIPPLGAFNQLRFRLKVTMPALFHACWLLVLQKHFGTVPILGVVVSGRSIDVEGAQEVIGPMFNTLPCLIEFGAGLSTADLVKACHQFNVDSLPFQHTALRDISKWIGHNPSQPLFDVLFVFQKEVEGLNASSELWAARESTSEPDFPLAVEVQQNLDDSFTITVVALPQHLDTEEVHSLLTSFEGTLYSMLENPDQFLPAHKATPQIHNGRTGILASELSSPINFVWTPEAKIIRQKVAALANASVHAIQAKSTIFELGLDSIDAIKLSVRLKAVGISLPVSEIMKSGTIGNMAQACFQISSTAQEEPSRLRFEQTLKALEDSLRGQGVAVDEYEKVLPATPLQEGMLANFEEYYSHDVLELVPNVDVRKLQTAWENMVYANSILRTSFIEVRDPNSAAAYAQLVHKVCGDHEILHLIHWRELTVGVEPDLDDVVTKQHLRMVERGLHHPMLDLTLVLAEPRKFLVLGMAHAIYDGWSIDLLHQDVKHWYSGQKIKRPPYEPALRHMLDDQDGASQRFWKNELREVSASLFPRYAKKPNTPALTLRDEMKSTHAAKPIQEFCKSQGVTAQALGLTCYSIALAWFLNKFDVCFGLVLSGRTTDHFDQVMFPTMNTVIFSTTLKGSRRDMLKDVHDRVLKISQHQFFPLRKAKSLCAVQGTLFDALFIYQKRPQDVSNPPQLYYSSQASSSIQHALNVEMEFDGANLLWRVACKDTILQKISANQIVVGLDRILSEVMRSPNELVVKPLSTNMVNICGIGTIEHSWESRDTAPESSSTSEEPSVGAMTEWSSLEKTIQEVLASVSGFPPEHISKKTSIFNLGLDSINSIKVSSILREKSISLPVSVMLHAPTVEKMAAAAAQATLVRHESQRPDPADHSSLITESDLQEALEHLKHIGIMPENVETIMPVSAGQDYVLGVWLASGRRQFYSNFFYKSVDPSLTLEKLRKAWNETVQQLPILRTTFVVFNECRTLQVQMRFVDPIIWVTNKEWPDAQPYGAAMERSDRSFSAPVKLLAKKSSLGFHIKLSIHHATYDAVSLPIIVSTLEKLCSKHGSTIQDAVEEVQTVTPSFLTLNKFINATRSPTAIQIARAFWTNYLASNRDLPREQSRTRFLSCRIEHYRPKLLGSVAEVEKIGRDHGLSFHSLFLATYAFVHGKVISHGSTGPKFPYTVTIGVYLANRSLDIEGLVDLAHPIFSVVPLRIKLSDNATIFDVAENIQGDLGKIGQLQNCGVSLSDIYEWTGLKVNCCVNFLKLPHTKETLGKCLQQSYFEPIASSLNEMDTSRINPCMLGPSPFTGSMPKDTSGVFLPSIDIEASVRDGGLDVGIFAPVDMLSDQDAMQVLEELQSLLSNMSTE